MKIKEILLSTVVQYSNHIDTKTDNTDVVVELSNGSKYVAPFFAYQNIEKLVGEHEISGDFLEGKYFYKHSMVLIDECSVENVRKVVEHMIDEGEFLLIFRQLS